MKCGVFPQCGLLVIILWIVLFKNRILAVLIEDVSLRKYYTGKSKNSCLRQTISTTLLDYSNSLCVQELCIKDLSGLDALLHWAYRLDEINIALIKAIY